MGTTESTHWLGPHNVVVPNHIDHVTDEDGVNDIYKDGTRTEMMSPPKDKWPTPDQYRRRNAKYDASSGNWFYVPEEERVFRAD